MNECTACGACCAAYRVDFSTQELQSEGGEVPDGLATPLAVSMCRLRGTDHSPPRCAALSGVIGERVRCGIYEWRPGPCRELEAGGEACNRARAVYGLPRL